MVEKLFAVQHRRDRHVRSREFADPEVSGLREEYFRHCSTKRIAHVVRCRDDTIPPAGECSQWRDHRADAEHVDGPIDESSVQAPELKPFTIGTLVERIIAR